MLLLFETVAKDLLALIGVLAGNFIFRQYILQLPIPLRGETIGVDDTAGRAFALAVGVFAWSFGIYGLYLFGR